MCVYPCQCDIPKCSQHSPSNAMSTHITSAPSSTFNVAGTNQHNYTVSNVYTSAQFASSSTQPSSQLLFNDAPIDLLSINFTGREKELALIARAPERSRPHVPLRCVLFGNQGVGKSQLTYEWARSTLARGENPYVMWISATTVEKLVIPRLLPAPSLCQSPRSLPSGAERETGSRTTMVRRSRFRQLDPRSG